MAGKYEEFAGNFWENVGKILEKLGNFGEILISGGVGGFVWGGGIFRRGGGEWKKFVKCLTGRGEGGILRVRVVCRLAMSPIPPLVRPIA
ncbi:MAG: hypothetical protein MPK36_07585, partial [Gammaproteobacteria bacterium]|nr:hypothetical protein [Gammaproteobacteria bacterium]